MRAENVRSKADFSVIEKTSCGMTQQVYILFNFSLPIIVQDLSQHRKDLARFDEGYAPVSKKNACYLRKITIPTEYVNDFLHGKVVVAMGTFKT